jgi:hypothetical protein
MPGEIQVRKLLLDWIWNSMKVNLASHFFRLSVVAITCWCKRLRILWGKFKVPAIFQRGPKVLCHASEEANVKSGTIATAIPATVEPELGKTWCPNRHDSSIPPKYPALIFAAYGHYSTQAIWNEFCITYGSSMRRFRLRPRGAALF